MILSIGYDEQQKHWAISQWNALPGLSPVIRKGEIQPATRKQSRSWQDCPALNAGLPVTLMTRRMAVPQIEIALRLHLCAAQPGNVAFRLFILRIEPQCLFPAFQSLFLVPEQLEGNSFLVVSANIVGSCYRGHFKAM
jgi:hypothetical protein